MPLERDLLETAKRLAKPHKPRGRPRQADLRRAISTAYYAVFHALCRMCADALIVSRRDMRNAWRQVYRAVEHRCSTRQCKDDLINKKFPESVRLFCGVFVELQEKRHKADYDPFACFTVRDVKETVKMANAAIDAISKQQLTLGDRRAFAIWLLVRRPRKD